MLTIIDLIDHLPGTIGVPTVIGVTVAHRFLPHCDRSNPDLTVEMIPARGLESSPDLQAHREESKLSGKTAVADAVAQRCARAAGDAAGLFGSYLTKWNLVPDGASTDTPTSRLLPVRHRGVPAVLEVAMVAEEKTGNALMVAWDGRGAARVLAHDADAVLLERRRHGIPGRPRPLRARRRRDRHRLQGGRTTPRREGRRP